MTVVNDVHRPDVGGIPPKMQGVRDAADKQLAGCAPVIRSQTDDNLMSSVWIVGSLDPRETWINGIWQNSRYFRFMLSPAGGQRYYEAGGRVEVELTQRHFGLPNFRKSTTTAEKAIHRIRQWLAKCVSRPDGTS
jgi:hypothetical protein